MQRRVAKIHPELDWNDLRVFLAVGRARGLVGGARALGVDKSTVSRRVEALERALGERLFLRTREGLRATAAGARLRAHAERVEAEVRALVTASVVGDEAVRGVVRVATTEGLAVRLVAGGLLDLRAEHPGLALELLAGNRPLDLARGEADLALRLSRPEAPSLKIRVAARFGIALFAAPSYLRERGLPRTAAQLAGHDVLLPSEELGALPEARWLAARPGVRVALRSSSLPALVAAAVRGHGLVALTRPWGDGEPGLDFVLALDHLAPRPIYLAVHPDVAERPSVRVVADRVSDLLRRAAVAGA